MSERSGICVLRSIAVTAEDVVDAFVYTRENPGRAVLRVTPPFHARMRARLHVYRVDDAPLTGAVHFDPAGLLDPTVVEAYPTVERIEHRHQSTTPADRRDERASVLDRWRERALSAIVDATTVETDDDAHEVAIKCLR